MKDILADVLATKRREVADARRPRRSMRAALDASPTGIIAEFKRKSPSKGWINPDAVPEEVIPSYAAAGAAALSILTDGPYFGGSLDFIRRVRPLVDIPILRKDFIIDEYQLYEAKEAGADAVLLIAAALSPAQCCRLADKARKLGLEILLEIHSESELPYLESRPDMLGVNNRNLGTFHTDPANSLRLARLLPPDLLKVSESGLGDPATIRTLRAAGYRGFLMGEAFMRQGDPAAALRRLISKLTT